jgi:hypothetical protein
MLYFTTFPAVAEDASKSSTITVNAIFLIFHFHEVHCSGESSVSDPRAG